jgi:probable rRNA maturation factor
VILNRQSEEAVDLEDARSFARRLHSVLRLGRRDFNVCFVSDKEIARLNGQYRKKPRPTDVLSFAWSENGARRAAQDRGFRNFLGDVIISARTARRNARTERHSFREELRWLILHGVLHLLGYDHATDSGEMFALELKLRDRLKARTNRKSQRLIV